ncbi:hypothetical protein, partial [Klebsiella variicola]|uniref:hypothetical protein n=1 Tax=Klebsiella variicola TaxID=244366 RepID=UPI001C709D57
CSPMTSLKTSIKTITYLSDIGCLEIQGASLAASISGIFSKQPCCSLEIRLSQKSDLHGGKPAMDMIIWHLT